MQFIDPHLHLFDLTQGQYHWLKPQNPPFWSDKNIINKNFSETDIQLTKNKHNSEMFGFVHIEAGFNNQQPWHEIKWLESNCSGAFKSIAGIDLTLQPNVFLSNINILLAYKSVVGCRHILDEQSINILNHKHTLTNLRILAEHQLSFELQMSLANTIAVELWCKILKQVPNLLLMINHAGSPPYLTDAGEMAAHIHTLKSLKHLESNIAKRNDKNIDDELYHWLNGLNKLAQFKQCSIKCSGWEMFNRHYSLGYCEQIIAQCIEVFSFDRVMLASNFPLCLFSKSYQKLWHYQSQLPHYSEQQLKQLCFENAKKWYKFE